MDTKNVTAARPRTAGVVYRAALGTALPVDATSELAEAFKVLGHLSEDGFTNNNETTSEDIKDMGGTTVLTVQTEKTDTFAFKLIDALDKDVLAAVYGEHNVSGTLDTALAVTVNSDEPEEGVWVFETIMRGGVLQRIVVPDGKISALGEIAYRRNEAVGFDVTVTALPDTAGNTHYTYLSAPQTAGDEEDDEEGETTNP